jgi:hypothetical protein
MKKYKSLGNICLLVFALFNKKSGGYPTQSAFASIIDKEIDKRSAIIDENKRDLRQIFLNCLLLVRHVRGSAISDYYFTHYYELNPFGISHRQFRERDAIESKESDEVVAIYDFYYKHILPIEDWAKPRMESVKRLVEDEEFKRRRIQFESDQEMVVFFERQKIVNLEWRMMKINELIALYYKTLRQRAVYYASFFLSKIKGGRFVEDKGAKELLSYVLTASVYERMGDNIKESNVIVMEQCNRLMIADRESNGFNTLLKAFEQLKRIDKDKNQNEAAEVDEVAQARTRDILTYIESMQRRVDKVPRPNMTLKEYSALIKEREECASQLGKRL